MNDQLIQRARAFATEAHQRIDQRRKYTGQPYQVHLKAVAGLVASVSDEPALIAAAWLHDTVEDTSATFGDIEAAFGHNVAALVADLTDVSRPGDGNRSTRKAIDREHSAEASPAAKTVKVADIIDNCRDITRHDPAFARVYLREAAALLAVLDQADSRLRQQACRVLRDCATTLGLPQPLVPSPDAGVDLDADQPLGAEARMDRATLRLFAEAFTARSIAEPLHSFDAQRNAAEAAGILAAHGVAVAGVRHDGRVNGFVGRELLQASTADTANEGDNNARAQTCGDLARGLAKDQALEVDAPLCAVIEVLTRYDFGFVHMLGEVVGVFSRGDMQKPIVRMWLFGIITLFEMDMSRRIRCEWPDHEWTTLLSASRLEKAQTLFAERERRGQQVDLLDCLQIADKAQILMESATQRADFGFDSKRAAKGVIQDLASLRNNLAHAQDIVTHDWPQIARLARRIEESIGSHR